MVVTALPSYVISGRSFQAFVYGIAAHKVVDAFRAMGRNRTDAIADRTSADDGHAIMPNLGVEQGKQRI